MNALLGYGAYALAGLLAAAVSDELWVRRGIGLPSAVAVGVGTGAATYMAWATLLYWMPQALT